MNLEDWVAGAKDPTNNKFRKAVHLVLKAIANSENLSHSMAFKGGLLLGIRYENQRYTTDLDFSTDAPLKPNEEDEFKDNLNYLLYAAEGDLVYGLKCKVQKISKIPKLDNAKFPALKITIAYVDKDCSPSLLSKYNQNMCPHIVSIDYSFNEKTGEVEQVDIDAESKITCYTLESLIAEKFRSVLQQIVRNRYRSQDVYDLNFLLENNENILETAEIKEKILKILREKSIDKEIDEWLNKFGMRNPEIKNRALREYSSIAIQISEELPSFESSYSRVQTYFEKLPW